MSWFLYRDSRKEQITSWIIKRIDLLLLLHRRLCCGLFRQRRAISELILENQLAESSLNFVLIIRCHTDAPLLVLMMIRSLSAKTKLPLALAIVYCVDTSLHSGSERPSSIFLMKMMPNLSFLGSKYCFHMLASGYWYFASQK